APREDPRDRAEAVTSWAVKSRAGSAATRQSLVTAARAPADKSARLNPDGPSFRRTASRTWRISRRARLWSVALEAESEGRRCWKSCPRNHSIGPTGTYTMGPLCLFVVL